MYSFLYPVPLDCCSSCLKMWYTCHRIGSERDGREACNILHAAGPSKVLLYHNILNPLRPMILSLLWIWESNLCTMVNYHLSIAILQLWSWSTFCTRVATFLVLCNWSYLLIKKKDVDIWLQMHPSQWGNHICMVPISGKNDHSSLWF